MGKFLSVHQGPLATLESELTKIILLSESRLSPGYEPWDHLLTQYSGAQYSQL